MKKKILLFSLVLIMLMCNGCIFVNFLSPDNEANDSILSPPCEWYCNDPLMIIKEDGTYIDGEPIRENDITFTLYINDKELNGKVEYSHGYIFLTTDNGGCIRGKRKDISKNTFVITVYSDTILGEKYETLTFEKYWEGEPVNITSALS